MRPGCMHAKHAYGKHAPFCTEAAEVKSVICTSVLVSQYALMWSKRVERKTEKEARDECHAVNTNLKSKSNISQMCQAFESKMTKTQCSISSHKNETGAGTIYIAATAAHD